MMKVNEFLNIHAPKWNELSALVARIHSKGLSSLSAREIDRLIWLYKSSANDLARIRTGFPDSDSERKLNDLCAQAYNIIYQNHKKEKFNILATLTRDFPESVVANMRFILFSLAVFSLFSIAGLFADKIDVRIPNAVVPQNYMELFENELETRGHVERDIEFKDRSIFSSQLIIHNIKISILAIASGITFGIGTLYLISVNGLLLGCLGVLFIQHGKTLNYLAYIMPHGVIELSAIIIAGAAGFKIGYSLLNPCDMTRFESVKKGVGDSFDLVIGVVAMLFLAGIIEAFFTPVKWISDESKLVFSGILFVIMFAFFANAYRLSRRSASRSRLPHTDSRY